MNWKQVLKNKGHSNDQAFSEIMKFFEERGSNGSAINKNELTLMGFKRFRKARRDYVKFSTETIGRKARTLAEIGLLTRIQGDDGYTYYKYHGENKQEKKVEYFIRDRNGNRIQVV